MEYWYAMTGPKHWQDLHIAHMQSVDLFISGTAPNGQAFQQGIKGIYEPIQLVRYIVPREAMPLVINTLGGNKDKGTIMNTFSSAFRKILGLQEIPQIPAMNVKLPVSTDYLNIIPIGIKDDGEDRIISTTGIKQEPI